jgi:hypothetical protein
MASVNTEVCEPAITETEGRLFIKVPWKQAEHIQGFFKTQGIGSTLHLDPWAREARLELWTWIDSGRLRALLDQQMMQVSLA